MLFNSYSFIFLFLPAICLGYLLLGRLQSRPVSLGWIVLCSILFYGIWNPYNLAVILPSIAINYGLALLIRRSNARGEAGQRTASTLLTLGVLFNLGFLGYFKYKNFFLDSLNLALGTQFELVAVILPLGISFITFQKIAFLLDVRSETVKDFDLYDFLVFVFFFPQLIAGPIVHYREMMPQFDQLNYRFSGRDVAVGLSLFAIGLFKKVVLADGVAVHVGPAFSAAEQGQQLDFFAAWMGALAYTFQIYFDFSGYSDMAIGLARLFGIRLPVNFNSPLKASSIIDFWARWHITLTRFLTAYIYTPVVMALTRRRMQAGKPVLGRGPAHPAAFLALTVFPTVLTMFVSGFWHGAGFTFLIWGLLHGVYLCINHGWRQWRPKWDKQHYERVMKPLGFVLTLLAVVLGMVWFRARNVGGALEMMRAMSGAGGATLPDAIMTRLGSLADLLQHIGIHGSLSSGTEFAACSAWLLLLFLIATLAPNSLELLRHFEPALHYVPPKPPKAPKAAGAGSVDAAAPAAPAAAPARPLPALQFTLPWALLIAAFFVLGAFGLNRVSEFLYWQF
ncbi:MBOAT family O-acyltransferase [Paucibacter sp. APW11]|uniref:Probable alginate O-acetylase AlgI n=1 Tax=Roseateles aquae TaxID=3077235 RepID=A0ABU3PEB1_9BURK|nr:MBOAT family O-acyltransferase [Paucibacter sp. APW11]MDT9000884.1 MBOAT family O-acyltransferase [Paucibacter sp. APW11]